MQDNVIIGGNSLNIRIKEFYTQSEPVKDSNGRETGELVARDYVAYGPPHALDRQLTPVRVDRLLKAKRPSGNNNIHEMTSWALAEYVRPLYEAWKRGEELPEEGTPISVLPFLRKEELAVLKSSGIKSVEDLARLNDRDREAVKLPAMREKCAMAKRWLEAQDTNKAAAAMAARDAEIAELKAQMADLIKAVRNDEPEVDENGDRIPKRRGRPPKAESEAA